MLGQRINELRIAMGWSQVQLAEKLSISKQTVSNWENENIQPSIEMLVRIAKLFHVSTDYLLGLETAQTINVDTATQIIVLAAVLEHQTVPLGYHVP